jgi:hypothetical protein
MSIENGVYDVSQLKVDGFKNPKAMELPNPQPLMDSIQSSFRWKP